MSGAKRVSKKNQNQNTGKQTHEGKQASCAAAASVVKFIMIMCACVCVGIIKHLNVTQKKAKAKHNCTKTLAFNKIFQLNGQYTLSAGQ